MISFVVSEVCLVREVPSRGCYQATWMARSMGTLVKRKTKGVKFPGSLSRETPSKKSRLSSSLRVCEDMNVEKSVELHTL